MKLNVLKSRLALNKAFRKVKPLATDLENQIEQMVYQLYGLTEEEIEIVENA